MNVVIGPQLAVGSCGADFKAASANRMKEQRGAPTIDELAIGIQGDMLIWEKTVAREVFSAKEIGPIFVGAEGTVCCGFEQEAGIVHEAREESEIVLGGKVCIGVVAKDSFAKEGKMI